jgi:tetratricopeptide (TPR) repeat protein
MSERGYEILALDDLDRYSTTAGAPVIMPLRRRLGFQPYGLNCWTADAAGGQLIEGHYERDGTEELYVVVRGRATFTLGEETVDAPAGTLVHAPPGTFRQAVAAEEDTIVLAVGAKAGEAFKPTGWEDFVIAYALRRTGDVEGGRALIGEALARDPEAWQGQYNAACFESLAGDADAAFEHLRRAVAGNSDEVRRHVAEDPDFEPIRDDPRWPELIG